jgi:threonine synthase
VGRDIRVGKYGSQISCQPGAAGPTSFNAGIILAGYYRARPTGGASAGDERAVGRRQVRLATREGIFGAPEEAATVAALEALVGGGWVRPDELNVVFNTGTGLKYSRAAGGAVQLKGP